MVGSPPYGVLTTQYQVVPVFFGPCHAGALEEDYIEVFADTAANGAALIFRAMMAQDPRRI